MNEQVAARLREEIKDKGWEPGRKMPSVREIAATHGVSTVTAGRALRLLSKWGYVRAESTRGYFVASRTGTEDEHSPEYLALLQELQAIRSDVDSLADRLQTLEDRLQSP